jgi:hypothetical protein
MEDPVDAQRSDVPVRGWVDRVVVPQEGRSTWVAVVVVPDPAMRPRRRSARIWCRHLVRPFVLLAAALPRRSAGRFCGGDAVRPWPAVDARRAATAGRIGRGLCSLVGVVTGLIDRSSPTASELGLAEQERDFAIRQAP